MSNSIDQLLALKTWAVVGLSNNSERAAYRVSKLLMEKGHQVVPVHPKAETVHGQQGYAKLSDIPFVVDVVDIFVNSELAGEVVHHRQFLGQQQQHVRAAGRVGLEPAAAELRLDPAHAVVAHVAD